MCCTVGGNYGCSLELAAHAECNFIRTGRLPPHLTPALSRPRQSTLLAISSGLRCAWQLAAERLLTDCLTDFFLAGWAVGCGTVAARSLWQGAGDRGQADHLPRATFLWTRYPVGDECLRTGCIGLETLSQPDSFKTKSRSLQRVYPSRIKHITKLRRQPRGTSRSTPSPPPPPLIF